MSLTPRQTQWLDYQFRSQRDSIRIVFVISLVALGLATWAALK